MHINKQLKLRIYIPIWIIAAIAFILFIFATFYDMQMMDFFTKWENNQSMKWFIAFEDELGNMVPLFSLYICFSIVIETIFKYLKVSKKSDKKISNWFSRNELYFLWGFYIILAFLMIYYASDRSAHTLNEDDGWGPGNDVKLLGPKYIRFWMQILVIVFTIIHVFVMPYIMRVKYRNSNKILEKKYWEGAVKIMIFTGYTYIMIALFKRIWGRPYYFSVIYEKNENGESIVEMMKSYGWEQTSLHGWGQADYYPWWKPNHFIDNLTNWAKSRQSFWNEPGQWWNNDFPSGHTSGVTNYIALIILFAYANPKKSKLNRWQIIFYTVVILEFFGIQLALVVFRFHWVTDVTFSVFIGLLLWYLASLTVDAFSWRIMFCLERKYNKSKIEIKYIFYKSANKKFLKVFIEISSTNYNKHELKSKIIKNNDQSVKKIIDKYNNFYKPSSILIKDKAHI